MTDRRRRFEELYAKTIDPWEFRTSAYEKQKYSETVAAIPKARYRCGIEAGCSIGELSRLLGERCELLFGIDVSQTAIDEAKRRNADRPNLCFLRSEIPDDWPSMRADLIVLSEVLYYMTEDEMYHLADTFARQWEIGGDCIIVSFLGETSEMLQGAESANLMIAALRTRMEIDVISSQVAEQYRLDVLQNVSNR